MSTSCIDNDVELAESACTSEAATPGLLEEERRQLGLSSERRERIRLGFVKGGQRTYRLRREIEVILEQAFVDAWVCRCDALPAMGYGDSGSEALQNFMDDLVSSYEVLVGKNDEELTGDARDLRDRLAALMAIGYPSAVAQRRLRASPVSDPSLFVSYLDILTTKYMEVFCW